MVPPFLGALLIQLFFMLVEISRHAALRMTFSEQLLLYILLASYGFVICLLPGFCFWGVMEMIWKYGGASLKGWIPFHGLGAVLGIACGLTVANLGNVHDFDGQRFFVLGGVGWICGLVTAVLVRMTYQSKKHTLPSRPKTDF